MPERFNMRTWPLLRVILGVYGLALIGAAVAVWIGGGEIAMSPVEMIVSAAVLPIMAFVIATVGAWVNGVIVSREGIRGITLAFHRRTVRWDAIQDAFYAELEGHPFLALESAGTRWRLYVPLDIAAIVLSDSWRSTPGRAIPSPGGAWKREVPQNPSKKLM